MLFKLKTNFSNCCFGSQKVLEKEKNGSCLKYLKTIAFQLCVKSEQRAFQWQKKRYSFGASFKYGLCYCIMKIVFIALTHSRLIRRCFGFFSFLMLKSVKVKLINFSKIYDLKIFMSFLFFLNAN